MKSINKRFFIHCLIVLMIGPGLELSSPAFAGNDDAQAREQKARDYFTDLPVLTQDGKELRFFSDVLKDRIVIIGLFFTNCAQACPLTTAKMAEVQELLGDELGKKYYMVSVTLDPANDTPAKIKAYADKYKARKGWSFITGDPEALKKITYRLGHTSEQIEAHNTYFMVGNVNAARWRKVEPNLTASTILLHMRDVAGEAL